MKSIFIPLQITPKGLAKSDDYKQAIDQSLSLLMTTPCYSCVADPQYGFIFNNLRFEIFNEHEGVVYNSSENTGIFEGREGLYDKKISGSSKNLNTFAAELKQTIANYEKRLSSVSVSMTYIREERKIYITVKGLITETQADYQYTTTINVWK
jgi:phage baseplate assembly protein W